MIAINFRDPDPILGADELIGAEMVNADDDILLVSRKGQAIRFTADDTQLRPMGRATSGVQGMKFREGDSVLSMSVIRAEQVAAEVAAAVDHPGEGEGTDVVEQYVFTMTDGGFAKRSRISDYRTQTRGGLGIKAMSLSNEDRGGLVGAFIVVEGDEILSITSGGQVVRSPINDQFRATGRSTMGVKFVSPRRATPSPSSPAVWRRTPRSRRRSRRPRTRPGTRLGSRLDRAGRDRRGRGDHRVGDVRAGRGGRAWGGGCDDQHRQR